MPVWNTRVWKRFAADNERNISRNLWLDVKINPWVYCWGKSGKICSLRLIYTLPLGETSSQGEKIKSAKLSAWVLVPVLYTLGWCAGGSCSLHLRLACWRFLISTPSAGVLEVPDLNTLGWCAGGSWSLHLWQECWRVLFSTPSAGSLGEPIPISFNRCTLLAVPTY